MEMCYIYLLCFTPLFIFCTLNPQSNGFSKDIISKDNRTYELTLDNRLMCTAYVTGLHEVILSLYFEITVFHIII